MNNNDLNFSSFGTGPRKKPITGKATLGSLSPSDPAHPRYSHLQTQEPYISLSSVVPQNSFSPASEESDIEMRDYLGTILHRRYWIVLAVVISLIIGFFSKINFEPKYASSSRLRIISMTGVMDPWYGYDYVNANVVTTHMENLKSSRFLKQVARQLDTPLTAAHLSGLFTVSRKGEANIIDIRVETPQPRFSTRLANTLAEVYDKYDLAIKQKSFRDYENWVIKEMNIRQDSLKNYEARIREFFEENPEFYTKGKEGGTGIRLYSEDITNTNLELAHLMRQEYLVQSELVQIDSSLLKEVTYDKDMQKELMNMRIEQAQLLTKYQPNHPKVKDVTQKMKAIQKLLQQDASKESNTTTLIQNPRYQKLRDQIQEIKVQKDLLQNKKREYEKLQSSSVRTLTLAPELELRYSQLIRNKQSTEKMYFMLEEKLQETRLKKSATPQEVFFMDGSIEPGALIAKKSFNILSSLTIGLVIGVGICFFLEFFDGTIRKSKELESKYGINLLALIPKNDEDDRKRLLSLGNNELIKPQFEPYRRLLANLFPAGSNFSPTNRSLLITSALQGEGKTTTAAFLATTSALRGERVLIIDADLRRHNLHHVLGLENQRGLAEYLNEDLQLSDVVQNTCIANLSAISAGTDPMSLTQSYAKQKIQKLMHEAGQIYDLIILDSPPILQLTDTLTIAPLVSKTLLVFRSKTTPLKAGEEVIRQLRHIDAQIVGGILNDVSNSFWDQYYYQYYKYGYKYNYY